MGRSRRPGCTGPLVPRTCCSAPERRGTRLWRPVRRAAPDDLGMLRRIVEGSVCLGEKMRSCPWISDPWRESSAEIYIYRRTSKSRPSRCCPVEQSTVKACIILLLDSPRGMSCVQSSSSQGLDFRRHGCRPNGLPMYSIVGLSLDDEFTLPRIVQRNARFYPTSSTKRHGGKHALLGVPGLITGRRRASGYTIVALSLSSSSSSSSSSAASELEIWQYTWSPPTCIPINMHSPHTTHITVILLANTWNHRLPPVHT